jgi:hypothetical protein
MGMAQCSERQGKIDDAVYWYRAAAEASEVPFVHEQLRSAYERLDQQELAAGEQQWLDDYEKAQLERQQALEAQQRESEAHAAPTTSSAPGSEDQ